MCPLFLKSYAAFHPFNPPSVEIQEAVLDREQHRGHREWECHGSLPSPAPVTSATSASIFCYPPGVEIQEAVLDREQHRGHREWECHGSLPSPAPVTSATSASIFCSTNRATGAISGFGYWASCEVKRS